MEAYGAEVQHLSVGPELFYQLLMTLETTGFFNASLYTPFGIKGVEILGLEIAEQVRKRYNRDPDAVVITHAGRGSRQQPKNLLHGVIAKDKRISSIYAQFEEGGYLDKDADWMKQASHSVADKGTLEIYFVRNADGSISQQPVDKAASEESMTRRPTSLVFAMVVVSLRGKLAAGRIYSL